MVTGFEGVTYVDSAVIASDTMPDWEDDPSPEDFEVEIGALLASFVYHGVPVDVLIVNVLLKRVGEKAGPGRPQSVVEGLKPICEEDLARDTVSEGEKDLSENEYDILVEVVADEPADATVAIPSVDQ